MTTIHYSDTSPGTHAFIVGVGYYHHLPGGAGLPTTTRLGLGQVPSPAPSAELVANWMVNSYNSPGHPLVTLELAISPSGRRVIGGREIDVEGANWANVAAAFDRWYERCNADPENVAVMYFAGHGVERESHALLLEDYGAQSNREFDGAFEFEGTFNGMGECAARNQYYFIDACREVPSRLLEDEKLGARSLKTARLRRNWVRNGPVITAAARDTAAFGDANGPTYFARAMVEGLGGAAAERSADGEGWIASHGSLTKGIGAVLSELRRGSTQQYIDGGRGEITDAARPFHVYKDPPLIPTTVSCAPPEADSDADFRLEHLEETASYLRAPEGGPWNPQVMPGIYRLMAEFPSGRYRSAHPERKVTLYPPWPKVAVETVQ